MMPNAIEIEPSGPMIGAIRPPGSKSITNRALVCAALADGPSTLTGAMSWPVEGELVSADDLIVLVSLASQHDRVVGACNRDGELDRRAPVALHRIGALAGAEGIGVDPGEPRHPLCCARPHRRR